MTTKTFYNIAFVNSACCLVKTHGYITPCVWRISGRSYTEVIWYFFVLYYKSSMSMPCLAHFFFSAGFGFNALFFLIFFSGEKI